MPLRRGTLRGEDTDSFEGGITPGQKSDNPDDAIVVDLRKDEESLNWTKYGPADSRTRFTNLSEEEAHDRFIQVQRDLLRLRREKED